MGDHVSYPSLGRYMQPKSDRAHGPGATGADWSKVILGSGFGAVGARQVADRVSKIPHRRYVEPFLGRGDIYRAVAAREGGGDHGRAR